MQKISFLQKIMANEKLVCAGLILLSVASLAAAYASQYVYGLQPCILCLYQRAPYFIVAALGIAGLFISFKSIRLSSFFIIAAAIIFFCGSVIAFYHTGVEQKWWVSFLEGCKINFDLNDPSQFLSQIEQEKAIPCDEIPWQDPFIGLSMANYNALFSFIYGVLTMISGVIIYKKSKA